MSDSLTGEAEVVLSLWRGNRFASELHTTHPDWFRRSDVRKIKNFFSLLPPSLVELWARSTSIVVGRRQKGREGGRFYCFIVHTIPAMVLEEGVRRLRVKSAGVGFDDSFIFNSSVALHFLYQCASQSQRYRLWPWKINGGQAGERQRKTAMSAFDCSFLCSALLCHLATFQRKRGRGRRKVIEW